MREAASQGKVRLPHRALYNTPDEQCYNHTMQDRRRIQDRPILKGQGKKQMQRHSIHGTVRHLTPDTYQTNTAMIASSMEF